MSTHVLPAVYDLTAVNEDQIDVETRGQAIVAGDSYTWDFVVYDAHGDPLDGTLWSLAGVFRDAWVYDGGAVQATATVAWTTAALGEARLTLTPAQTAALTVDCGVFDVQLVNVSDPGWDVGFVQTALRGAWSLLKDSTR